MLPFSNVFNFLFGVGLNSNQGCYTDLDLENMKQPEKIMPYVKAGFTAMLIRKNNDVEK